MAGDPRVARRLANLRAGFHLDQSEVAKAVGIARSYLSQLENAAATPSLRTLKRLAQYYGVELSYLQLGFPPPLWRAEIVRAPEELAALRLFRDLDADQRRKALVLLLGLRGEKAAPPPDAEGGSRDPD